MGNLETQKTQILSQQAMLEAIHENRLLTEEEYASKASLLMEYEEHLKNEEQPGGRGLEHSVKRGGQKHQLLSQAGQYTQAK